MVTKLVGNFRLVGDSVARAGCAILNEDLPRDSTYVSGAKVTSYGMGAETNSMIALSVGKLEQGRIGARISQRFLALHPP